MPKATKSTKCDQHNIEEIYNDQVKVTSDPEESSSSDQEVFFQPQPQPSSAQVMPNMFIPYIGGPRMDWAMNDGLYNWFLKWKLKYENILECELVMLPEARKCKKVVAWIGDFSRDQYISWNLSSEELTLEVLWGKFEEFCKSQSNEVMARFDLLTSFRQGNRSVDEWYNAVQTRIALTKYHQGTAKILHIDIFCCFF